MKIPVFGSLDRKNDDFRDCEKVIDMGRLKYPVTPETPENPGISPVFQEKCTFFLKVFAKKFGSLNFMRTFAIPNNKSGGGEMVDTLL